MKMRNINIILCALALIIVASCKPKKGDPDNDIKIVPINELPGIVEAHGTIGEGTSMNMLELLTDDGDTVYVRIGSQAVMGGETVGDEVQVVYNVMPEDNTASIAINLTTLQHLWSQKGADGKEQSLELNSDGRASTYDMSVDYESWSILDGMLLLRSPKKLGDESPAIVDTFQIMELTEDNLVLMNGNFTTVFERYN